MANLKNNSLIISTTCLVLFILLLVGIKLGPFISLDNYILSYFNPSGFMLILSQAIALVFDTLSISIISLVIVLILYLLNKKKEAIFLALIILTDGIVVFIFKELLQRARPENLIETGFSFPSGHSTISIVFIGSLIYLFINNIKSNSWRNFIVVVLSLFILLIGFTRLYLQVHWFTDVIGGFLIGGAILFFYIYLFKRLKEQ